MYPVGTKSGNDQVIRDSLFLSIATLCVGFVLVGVDRFWKANRIVTPDFTARRSSLRPTKRCPSPLDNLYYFLQHYLVLSLVLPSSSDFLVTVLSYCVVITFPCLESKRHSHEILTSNLI